MDADDSGGDQGKAGVSGKAVAAGVGAALPPRRQLLRELPPPARAARPRRRRSSGWNRLRRHRPRFRLLHLPLPLMSRPGSRYLLGGGQRDRPQGPERSLAVSHKPTPSSGRMHERPGPSLFRPTRCRELSLATRRDRSRSDGSAVIARLRWKRRGDGVVIRTAAMAATVERIHGRARVRAEAPSSSSASCSPNCSGLVAPAS